MSRTNEPIVMTMSIIVRGKAKRYMEKLNERGIRYHLQTVGFGTAPSEMMDILGLGTNNKDVIFSFAPKSAVSAWASEQGKKVDSGYSYGGLAVVLSLSAINRMTAEILGRYPIPETEKGDSNPMKSEYKHNMIIISVNEGFADQVMQVARQAGATGGTIIRARSAGAEQLDQVMDVVTTEEKEIIAILSPENVSRQIMEAVNRELGLRSNAGATVCALPVEKAFKV
ncbi:MAG: hypothetical protein J6D21_02005 [Clostridia bacterium]|nr:hypothetical protein [Clostridia bacterium]